MAETCVIIGLGQIGMGYDFDVKGASPIYTHARAITVHPSFRLVGAADPSPVKRSRFVERYTASVFEHATEALHELQPDVVVIASPTETHAAIIRNVIDVCCPKAVLCEKPLAYDLDEARGIVELCEKAGVDLFVNFMRRTNPGVLEIKRRIENGEVSTPVKVNAWYSKGIMNNGSHILNLLEFWLGDVSTATVINPGRLWNSHDPEPDVELQLNLGNVIMRAAWEECFSHYTIELLSRSGLLRYEQGGKCIEWQGVHPDPDFDGYRNLAERREVITSDMELYQWHVYEQLSNHFDGLSTTLCRGHEALKTFEAINMIIRDR